jgi:hypothetical protein
MAVFFMSSRAEATILKLKAKIQELEKQIQVQADECLSQKVTIQTFRKLPRRYEAREQNRGQAFARFVENEGHDHSLPPSGGDDPENLIRDLYDALKRSHEDYVKLVKFVESTLLTPETPSPH